MNKPETFQNVFDTLRLPGAEELSAKAELAAKFIDVIRELGLSYEEAANEIGALPNRVEMACCADLDDFTIDELCRFLVALGQDIEIGVRRAVDTPAHLSVRA
ncbi:MAG: XRE family transcriptional regulator [Candidatus Hydrogenedentes bacterium]|nr:XRE family transcriptional regulator [Candidatus Hydrogenedentota bacterium]